MKVFVLTTVMAPYRVQLFSEIGKQCELYVCFEQMRSSERNEKWYDETAKNFRLVNLKKWDASLGTIKLEVIKHVHNIKPDVAIAYEYHTNTSLILLSYCKAMGIPYMINCDGAFVKKSIKDIIKKTYISKARGFISSGKMSDKYLLHYGADKECIYRNHFTSLHENDVLTSVPSLEDKENIKKKKEIPEKCVVLSVGQFIHRKGYDVFLKAAKNLSEDIGIYIVGGKATTEYEQLVKELDLKNVYFIDFMSAEELKYYYLAADLFVLPTREDVWGLVINEAMSYALPIVTTDHCVAGVELIEDGVNGYIVPIDNPERLGSAIEKVLSNEDLKNYMASENLNKIRDYTYEVSAQDIIAAIESVCESTRKKN